MAKSSGKFPSVPSYRSKSVPAGTPKNPIDPKPRVKTPKAKVPSRIKYDQALFKMPKWPR